MIIPSLRCANITLVPKPGTNIQKVTTYKLDQQENKKNQHHSKGSRKDKQSEIHFRKLFDKIKSKKTHEAAKCYLPKDSICQIYH